MISSYTDKLSSYICVHGLALRLLRIYAVENKDLEIIVIYRLDKKTVGINKQNMAMQLWTTIYQDFRTMC